MLHGNELPQRHLLQSLDGTTAGQCAFSGPLSKRLSTREQLPVTHFVKIIADLPNVNLKELSTDTKYLWQMTNTALSVIVQMICLNETPET